MKRQARIRTRCSRPMLEGSSSAFTADSRGRSRSPSELERHVLRRGRQRAIVGRVPALFVYQRFRKAEQQAQRIADRVASIASDGSQGYGVFDQLDFGRRPPVLERQTVIARDLPEPRLAERSAGAQLVVELA